MPVTSKSKKAPYITWPPLSPNRETDEEQRTRLKEERDAKCKSDSIDCQLKLEREEKQNKPSQVKVLLLGQAESGKSTILKNFQLYLAPRAFELEAEMWRPVIQLNLVRSVNFIVAFISNQGRHDAHPDHRILMSPKIRTLCLRLAPLRRVEEDFVRILSGQAPSEMQRLCSSNHALENAVSNGWKEVITLYRRSEEFPTALNEFDRTEDESNRRVLVALGEDIAALWHDEALQQFLKSAEITLEEQPGFFLDHAVRVTRENYKPRPDDVLRARVTTIGAEAHTIISEGYSGGHRKQWTIYDVGGSRNQRAVWAQFFDDVNAIIFLAPLSGFNQLLAEDETANRLADSVRLWTAICSNKLLASVELVLFLNKIDILDSKLRSGIQFSSFVSSYVDKPNETKPVAKYLLDVFITIHQQYSPKPRKLHPHLTCAVDKRATTNIIQEIQEIIFLRLLLGTELL